MRCLLRWRRGVGGRERGGREEEERVSGLGKKRGFVLRYPSLELILGRTYRVYMFDYPDADESDQRREVS